MDYLVLNQYERAKNTVFLKINEVIQIGDLENYLQNMAIPQTKNISKQSFVTALQNLNSNISFMEIDNLANNLSSRTGYIDITEFLSIYKGVLGIQPTEKIAIPEYQTTEDAVAKVTQRLVEYMNSKNIDSLSKLFIVKEENSMKVLDASQIRYFFEQKLLGLPKDDVELFVNEFKIPGNSLSLNYETMETRIYSALGIPTAYTLENMLEEIRKCTIREFIDICQFFGQYDYNRNGLISFNDFESGLKKIGARLPEDSIKKLCFTLDKAGKSMVSYQDLSKQLEEYSIMNSRLDPQDLLYPMIQTIRNTIKERQGNTLADIFKSCVTRDYDNNMLITTMAFIGCLHKIRVSLTEDQINTLIKGLDTRNTQQINYVLFCTKLGYIQPKEANFIRPGTGIGQVMQIDSAVSQLPTPIRTSPIQRKQIVNQCLVKAVKYSQSKNLPIQTIFQQYNSKLERNISQTEFLQCIQKLGEFTSLEISLFNEEFSDPTKFGMINFSFFLQAANRTATILGNLNRIFDEFSKKLEESKSDNLYFLLQGWDTLNNRCFTPPDFKNMMMNLCRLNFNPNDLEDIISFFDTNGIKTVDFDSLQTSFLSYMKEKPGSQKFNDELYKKNKVLRIIAEKVIQQNQDIATVLEKYDPTQQGTLPKEKLLKTICNLYLVDQELIPSLEALIDDCDTSKKGIINYKIFGSLIKDEIQSRGEIQEYLTNLRTFLEQEGIYLLKIFEKASGDSRRTLKKEQIISEIVQLGYYKDKHILSKILDTYPISFDGGINYDIFVNQVNGAKGVVVENQLLGGKTYEEKTEMIQDIGRSIAQYPGNILDIFLAEDPDKTGVVPEKSFAAVLKTMQIPKYEEYDYLSLARFYYDSKNTGVEYNKFISEVNQYVLNTPGLKKVKTQLKWAHKIIDCIILTLEFTRQDVYSLFSRHGMNAESHTINELGFRKGIKELKLRIQEKEIDQLANDLISQVDGTVSIEDLKFQIDERKRIALTEIEGSTIKIVKEFIKNRKIDLLAKLNKYDPGGIKQISSFDFQKELNQIFRGNLSDLQYAFLVHKYEISPGIVNQYAMVLDLSQEAPKLSNPKKDPLIQVLLGKLRKGIRYENIKVASALQKLCKTLEKKTSAFNLLDIIPPTLLSKAELEELIPIIDPKNTGDSKLDDICEVLWTNIEEENNRSNSAFLAKITNQNIRDYCNNKKIDLEAEFNKLDKDSIGFLYSDDIEQTFINIGRNLSKNQLSYLLYYQPIETDEKYRINYKNLVKIIFTQEDNMSDIDKRPKTSMQDIPSPSEENKLRPYTAPFEERKDSKIEFNIDAIKPIEVVLTEEMIDSICQQLTEIKKYLTEKGVKIDEEFRKYERDGYLDFSRYCQVLVEHQIELPTQIWQNAFYSYFKEEAENKVSLKRVVEGFVQGKRLKQYKSQALLRQQESLQSQIISSGLHFKRLADYFTENKMSANDLNKYASGGRNFTKAGLASCFEKIKYVCSAHEIDLIFKAIDTKQNGNGSLPLLKELIEEHMKNREIKKVAFAPKVDAVIRNINRLLEEKKIPSGQFYRALDFKEDGYVSQDEFIEGITKKLGLMISSADLIDVFNTLDANQYLKNLE